MIGNVHAVTEKEKKNVYLFPFLTHVMDWNHEEEKVLELGDFLAGKVDAVLVQRFALGS